MGAFERATNGALFFYSAESSRTKTPSNRTTTSMTAHSVSALIESVGRGRTVRQQTSTCYGGRSEKKRKNNVRRETTSREKIEALLASYIVMYRYVRASSVRAAAVVFIARRLPASPTVPRNCVRLLAAAVTHARHPAIILLLLSALARVRHRRATSYYCFP